MLQVWLSIGSNIDREKNIHGAVNSLREAFGKLVLSSVYESEAVGFEGDPFYNMVVGLETNLSARDLVSFFQDIEKRYGRVRGGEGFSSRTLDIDLLLYGDEVVNDGELEIPRNEITCYAFVLQPLAEVAGEMRHPVDGRTYQELWEAFEQGRQRLWPVEFDFS